MKMKFIEDGLEWSCNTEHSKRHNAQIQLQYKLFQFDFLANVNSHSAKTDLMNNSNANFRSAILSVSFRVVLYYYLTEQKTG